jgi:hypothetical protein
VRLGTLGIPPGIQLILGDMFMKNEVPVHFSEIDNDDTIASHA